MYKKQILLYVLPRYNLHWKDVNGSNSDSG